MSLAFGPPRITIDSPVTILVGGAGVFVDAFTHVHQLKRKRRVFILYKRKNSIAKS